MPARLMWPLCAGAGVALAATLACGGPGGAPVAPNGSDAPAVRCADRPAIAPAPGVNIVLVVNDTMRRDRTGTYGGAAATPNLDRLAAAGLRFDLATSPSPWTKPAMASLFTGLYPSQHGVVSHPYLRESGADAIDRPPTPTERLADTLPSLPETLRRAGYETAAFMANPWLVRPFGFDRAFETWEESFASWDAPGTDVVAAAAAWLETRDPERPFFLYLHLLDSHRPYPALTRHELADARPRLAADRRPVEAYVATAIDEQVRLDDGAPATSADVPAVRALLELAYDRGIERFDDALGLLLDRLDRHADPDRTAVVVTSDHGEALFERGWDNHGLGLYDDELAVPLVITAPGLPPGSATCRVSLIDLFPTIAAYTGVAPPAGLPGIDLLGPLIERRDLVAEAVIRHPTHRALRSGPHKLIWQPDGGPDGKVFALFDLIVDPGERHDLLESPAAAAVTRDAFEDLAVRIRRAVPAYDTPPVEPTPIDPEVEKRLRSLGYTR